VFELVGKRDDISPIISLANYRFETLQEEETETVGHVMVVVDAQRPRRVFSSASCERRAGRVSASTR
jgi:hypothetical protein